MQPIVLIPAYKPEPLLIDLVTHINQLGHAIIVINDGSPVSYNSIFEVLETIDNVRVITHAVNLGKGQALKTGFNSYLTHYPDHTSGIITADADGQHLVKDIVQIADCLIQHPQALCLGVRQFDGKVPLRSRFGNQLTRMVFKLFTGKALKDTQTGLRGIPRDFIPDLLNTTSQGYDFELDMLVLAAKNKRTIKELEIHTIYENQNASSHFNPLIDSFKIYFVFVRFLAFSIISGLLDFFVFIIAFWASGQLLYSESAARLLSGTFNFMVNKSIVFKSHDSALPQILKYILLCMANLICSYALINCLVYMGFSVALSKLLSLLGLFVANFSIQNDMIFSRQTTNRPLIEKGGNV